MDELSVDIDVAKLWFESEYDSPYVFVRISEEHAATWEEVLAVPFRQCYIDDSLLSDDNMSTNPTNDAKVASKMPTDGPVMSGDFGEILTYIYHATAEPETLPIGPKKWRLKQDRNHPAPHSDVVQFVLPGGDKFSAKDKLLCSEVKSKATKGNTKRPIRDAIDDCKKDRTGRMLKTLLWFRDRAMTESLGATTPEILDRFIQTDAHPKYKKRFRAVAVVCEDLVEKEIERDAPNRRPRDYNVVVISVPNQKELYEKIFKAAQATVAKPKGVK